ncbi:MAG: DUF2510 domain-containing protein [Acidimicrobiales bacterium]
MGLAENPPAGWYPQQEGIERYWDGDAWTEHTRPPSEGAPDAARSGTGRATVAVSGLVGTEVDQSDTVAVPDQSGSEVDQSDTVAVPDQPGTGRATVAIPNTPTTPYPDAIHPGIPPVGSTYPAPGLPAPQLPAPQDPGPSPASPNPGEGNPAPGYPGPPPSASPYPGGPAPAPAYPGNPPAASQYPGNPPAASQYPGNPYPASQYPGNPPAASQYPGNPYPASQYPGNPYPAPQPYAAAYGVRRRDPALALLCSFFIPGLGNAVAGEAGKGVVIFLLWLVSVFVGSILFFLLLPLFFPLGVWIYGMVDAYNGAKHWNAAHGIYV